MDPFVNLANVLYVVAYFTTDMLRLRLLTLAASACLVIYFLNQPVPMLNVVVWNCASSPPAHAAFGRMAPAGIKRASLDRVDRDSETDPEPTYWTCLCPCTICRRCKHIVGFNGRNGVGRRRWALAWQGSSVKLHKGAVPWPAPLRCRWPRTGSSRPV